MAAAPSPSSTRYPVGLAVASLAWAIMGWLGATLAPQLAFLPGIEILHALLPAITLALIVVNLGYALQAVFRHRVPIERLLLVTTAQLALFTTLFFQIDAHFEANCYWTESPTDPWMWLGFSAAHALRASDILDTVEAFDLNIQVVKHRHPLVAGLVVLYHIVVDLFMLGLFRVIVEDLWIRWIGNNEARRTIVMRTVLCFFGIWLLVWLSCAFYFRPWNSVDIPIWLVENVVRVIDFPDLMDSYELHWHQVPKEPLECTLTFFCRVWIVVGISLFLRWRTTHARIQPLPQPVRTVEGSRLWPLLVVPSMLFVCVFTIDRFLKQGNEQAVAMLIEAATGKDQGRSEKALAALRRVGPNALSAIDPLREECLHNPDRATVAIQTLAHLGPKALPALEAIAESQAQSEPVVDTVVTSLTAIGPSAAPVLVAIWSQPPSPEVKKRIEAILLDMGPAAVRPLITATTRENSGDHYHWFHKLDRNWTLRDPKGNAIFERLVKLPGLTRKMTGHDSDSRTKAIEALGDMGPVAKEAIPNLIVSLKDSDIRVSTWTIEALVKLSKEAVPALISALKESDSGVKNKVAYVLGKIGPAAKEAVPVLLADLKDSDSNVRQSAAEALGGIDPELAVKEAVPMLLADLKVSDAVVRSGAAKVLGKIDPKSAANKAVPLLMAELKTWYPTDKSSAVEALGKIGPAAKEAVPALVSELTGWDMRAKQKAAKALGEIGPAAKDAVPALITASSFSSPEVRQSAAEALKRIRGH